MQAFFLEFLQILTPEGGFPNPPGEELEFARASGGWGGARPSQAGGLKTRPPT